jgi:small subunit ribosomal protein S9
MATKKDKKTDSESVSAEAAVDKEKKVVKKTVPKAAKAPAKKTASKAVAAKKGSAAEKESEKEPEMKKGSYIPAVGRRKTSVARIRLIKNGKGTMTVNGRSVDDYFGGFEYRTQVREPLIVVGQADAVDVSIKVNGGGLRGQAEAIRHGLSRALIQLNPTFRKSLKKLGYLTRDPRAKERKKPGLKKARRAPQWSKR